MNKLVSIIVPVYNSEKYLSECLDSLLSQTYDSIEIVIVDDGSTDNSFAICKKYARDNKNVKVLRKKNSGAGAARMAGLKAASGSIIMFVDSDDFIDVNAVSKIMHIFDESGADIVRFHGKYYPDGKVLEKVKVKGAFLRMPYDKIIQVLSLTDKLSSMCFQAYKKECLEDVLFPNSITYCEDYITNQRIHLKKHDLVVINDVLYSYRRNNQSTTKTRDQKRLKKNIEERMISCGEIMHLIDKRLSDKKLIKTITGAQVERIRPDLLKYFSTFDNEKELAEGIKEIYCSSNFEKFIVDMPYDSVKQYLRSLSFRKRLKTSGTVKAIYDRNVKKTIWNVKKYKSFVAMKEGARRWA